MIERTDNFIIDAKFLLESSDNAFCGAPLLKTTDGQDLTVVFGFTRDLLRLRLQLGIVSFVCLFDSEAPIASPENFYHIVEFMKLMKVPMICEKGARSSILKSLAQKARWIVTQDLSLAQLITNDCHLLILKENGEITTITINYLKKYFGIRPTQVPSFLALHDEKHPILTKRQAIKFLEDHDSLTEILNGTLNLNKNNLVNYKIHQNKEVIQRSFNQLNIENQSKLQIKCNKTFARFPKDFATCEKLLTARGFYSLPRMLHIPKKPTIDIYSQFESTKVKETDYQVVDSEQALLSLKNLFTKTDICSVDTETSGKDPRTAKLYGVSISIAPGRAFYIPLIQISLKKINPAYVTKQLSHIFSKPIKVIGHNMKYDLLVLHNHGIKIKNPYFDTLLAAYQCHGDSDFFNLSHLAKIKLGVKVLRYKEIVREGETFLDVPFSELVEHACRDADITLQLYKKITAELKKKNVLDIYHSETMNTMRELHKVEVCGIPINLKKVKCRIEFLSKKSAALKKKIFYIAGFEFDLESLKAIGDALKRQEWYGENFNTRHISTPYIEQMAPRHPMIGAIAEYRRLRRKINEISDVLTKINKGKTQPIFNQIRESCGKIVSSDPCLDEVIAAGAITDELICGNWFNLKHGLMKLSILSKDPHIMTDIIDQRSSSFLMKSTLILGVPNLEVLIFVVVNQSDESLSKHFLISRSLASKVHREIADRYSLAFNILNLIHNDAIKTGYVEQDGRRKYFDGLQSSDIYKRKDALVAATKWLLFNQNYMDVAR